MLYCHDKQLFWKMNLWIPKKVVVSDKIDSNNETKGKFVVSDVSNGKNEV